MYMILNFVKKSRKYIVLSLFICTLPVAAAPISIQKPALMSGLSSKVLLTGSEKLSANTGYVGVGLYGHIVYSENGNTWSQARSPVQILLTNVFFLNDKLGWVTGHDAVILHTNDGGINWQLQYEDPIPGGDIPKPLLDVYFADENNGFASGAYGLMLKTNNGGKDWSPVATDALYEKLMDLEMEPEPNFNSLIPFGDRLLIAGELGTLLMFDPAAEDEDSRWTLLDSPYVGSFFGASLVSDDLYIYGLRGNVYHSSDAGTSWNKIETGVVTNIYDCIDMKNGSVVFLGSGGTILTLKRGETVTEKQSYLGFDSFMSGELVQGNELLVFGSSGVKKLTIGTSQ
ncbi:MAG: hypothetical protein A6F72_04960 [Cycloclasticus sp. symbiont of Poecilosclerida sp. N]|nr:MAG: hypothetical protein A6F72_04960 [Cycloclasticus sp. symbiont of Poecilosclerida sp. N]